MANSRLIGPALLPIAAASIGSTVGAVTLTQIVLINGPSDQVATIWIGSMLIRLTPNEVAYEG